MLTFNVTTAGGPSLDIEAEDSERAWDEYKRRTGIRRKPGDEAPRVIELPALFTPPAEG